MPPARHKAWGLGAALLLVVSAWPAAGQVLGQDLTGDVASGRRLAEAWCAECHAIGPKAVDRPDAAPDFVEIARRPSTTALSLNVFLRSPHPSMPNFIIARAEADDIVAYILSLRSR